MIIAHQGSFVVGEIEMQEEDHIAVKNWKSLQTK